MTLPARRPLLFSTLVTLAFLALLFATAVLQKATAQPALQEALGAVGRAVIAAGALLWLDRLGWRRWIAGAGSGAAWLLVVPPLAYVLAVYPPLFSGSYRMPAVDSALLAAVAANGFMAGIMEELVFRGLVLGTLVKRLGAEGPGLWRALILSSVFFSVPHALNLLAGAALAQTAAQLVWALLLGVVFGALVVAGGSLWPVALVHGVSNALVHANRYGHAATSDPVTAVMLALAPIPLLAYAWLALRRGRRLARAAASPIIGG